MMAGRKERWKGLQLLIIFILLSLTEEFEVKEDEWENLSPSFAALYRLRGLSERMSHRNLQNSSGTRMEISLNLMTFLNGLHGNGNFTASVLEKEQDLVAFLDHLEKHKTDDWLITASEISHSYEQKLLVVVDQEQATKERVKQEYNMDPHRSVILTVECLCNTSCAPGVDRNTVVKIYGNVTEDGQMVSGLNGSSLADLILKPQLDAAFFSVDGNTTEEFQLSFIQVLMVRNPKAVLETNQGSQHIYKVMDQTNSVSSYRIRRQAVDPTTQYDHQQIIILQNDQTVKTAATYLYQKHPAVTSLYRTYRTEIHKITPAESVDLSENSRLVLVGHGKRDESNMMKLAGLTSQGVSEIIQKTNKIGKKIKTTRVVACEVGSDKQFIESLLKSLYRAGIETELHLWNTVIQVTHTGNVITKELIPNERPWSSKDSTKKVVATIDKNQVVTIRQKSESKGEPVFTEERNFLGDPKGEYRSNWPDTPTQFLKPEMFKEDFSEEEFELFKHTCEELEGLSWGLFYSDHQRLENVDVSNPEFNIRNYVIGERLMNNLNWINDAERLHKVLQKCYVISSGRDIRNIIRHYAKDADDRPTNLMVNDWIFIVDPLSLYVYPVGKKVSNPENMEKIKKWLIDKNKPGKERYSDIRAEIKKPNRKLYANYVREFFLGEHKTQQKIPVENDGLYAWYFTASVIAESARNFRTFPLVLMALDMGEIHQKTSEFWFDEHPMARGGSWIDTPNRGFNGAVSSAKGKENLRKVLDLEHKMFTSWKKALGENELKRMAELTTRYRIFEDIKVFEAQYHSFKSKTNHPQNPSSGQLGGNDDGSVTSEDLNSGLNLENSFKLQQYFLRTSTLIGKDINAQLEEKIGENLSEQHIHEDSARIEGGQFVCQLQSVDAEPVEFRAELSSKSEQSYEQLLKNMNVSLQEMEKYTLTSAQEVNKSVERGTAVGVLGLVLGMKEAAGSFEQEQITDGVLRTLKSVDGETSWMKSVIARNVLSSETKILKAAAEIMKDLGKNDTATFIPILGMGFGIYKGMERNGLSDVLDIIKLFQPKSAPVLPLINLALSTIWMVKEEVYLANQLQLHGLPKDTGVLDRVRAVSGSSGRQGELADCFFNNCHYDEIEEGLSFIRNIPPCYSDMEKLCLGRVIVDCINYNVPLRQDGPNTMAVSSNGSSWNVENIVFTLADQGQSELCLNYTLYNKSSTLSKYINTEESKDIVLGLMDLHDLEIKTLQEKIVVRIPAGLSRNSSDSRYGTYRGNKDSNHFFVVQTADDQDVIEGLLSYYYRLYGESGDDIFFLGPQRSYVEGSGGKDTYFILENGGKTVINNYDLSKESDVLYFNVAYSNISVYKSGDHVVLMYESSHSVTIENWFLGELYRHMIMMSGDGVLFEISSTVVTSVKLVATAINKMFEKQGQSIDASHPLLCTVTNIIGTQFEDVILGNDQNNLIDGGGGRDRLTGGEGEDIYNIKGRTSSVWIENVSKDRKTDLAIIEANVDSFNLWVEGDDVKLEARHDNTPVYVTLVNWFRSPADRHLIIVTKDLVTFTISDNKADCLQSNKFLNCIKLQKIDYSSSSSPLVVDLQEDTALTEVRGSKFNDVIKGNKEHNIFLPGGGHDFIEGRGGEDWYVIPPGEGMTTINNQSPDLVLDKLFLKEQYESLASVCEQQNIIILVNGRRTVVLQNWFHSRDYQHLQIRTSDGITAGLKTNISSCGEALILPLIIDYRNRTPEELWSFKAPGLYSYRSKLSIRLFGGLKGKEIMMTGNDSVKEMYGSSGFDIMVGNKNDNLLDPYTGGAIMSGREGEDTYIIKRGYGDNVLIDNFAQDQRTDTVLVDMDFIDGGQVVLDSSTEDLSVTIKTEGEELKFSLLSYSAGDQHQHLDFLSSDGVRFKLKPLNSSADAPRFQVEAFKVTLKQAEVDCRLDLSTQRNLSKVQTAQGCPSQSNYMVGNNQDNVLIGGWKDDALDGGEGDDTLIGGHGADILIGGMGDDTLYGEDGNDTMMGDSGRDVFIPGPGSDLVDGGSGRDTVLYRGDHETGSGVYVNLLSGQGHYADAEGDVLKDVETVIGTIYSDILVSGYESSLLKGSDGNDILVSTGEDYLVGGDGNDIYLLAFDQGSVTIDNCAKDNATDVLYLSSLSFLDYDLQSEGVVLTFSGSNQPAVNITVKGWISDGDECGHLMLVLGEKHLSLGELLKTSRNMYVVLVIVIVLIGLLYLLLHKRLNRGNNPNIEHNFLFRRYRSRQCYR